MAGSYKEYEVENIISCRVATNGRISYLVRWKGFDADDDTWEPEEHLRGCKDLVLRFFKERDVNPTKSAGYLILHMKKECPKPERLRKSSPEHFVSDYSSRKSYPRRQHLPATGQRERVRSDSEEESPMKYNAILKPESPYSNKLRLTPERQKRVVENRDQVRGRTLFRNRDRSSSRKKSREKPSVCNNGTAEKSPGRKIKEEKNTSSASQNCSHQLPDQLISNGRLDQCKTFLLQVILNILFSLALIAVLYSFLVYDLS